MIRQYSDMPLFVGDFLFYKLTILNQSSKTVDAYHIDLRHFLRFIALYKGYASEDIEYKYIVVDKITLDDLNQLSLEDVYRYLSYLVSPCNNSAKTRARKLSAIKGLYKYLTIKTGKIKNDPVKDIETPKIKKDLPKHLTLEQSLELLKAVDGAYKERDLCIITFFLNCGMRLSELVGIDISDISDNKLVLTGKGDKQRVVYLNKACMLALETYMQTVRNNPKFNKEKALFLSRTGSRLVARRVEQIIEQNLKLAGLDNLGMSTHKLRHTAATLMYQYGEVDIRILQEILGHVNLGTTQIYTHVSNRQLEQATKNNPLSGE